MGGASPWSASARTSSTRSASIWPTTTIRRRPRWLIALLAFASLPSGFLLLFPGLKLRFLIIGQQRCDLRVGRIAKGLCLFATCGRCLAVLALRGLAQCVHRVPPGKTILSVGF